MAYLIILCCALLHMSLIGSDIALRHPSPCMVLYCSRSLKQYLAFSILCLAGWLMSASPDTSLSYCLSS